MNILKNSTVPWISILTQYPDLVLPFYEVVFWREVQSREESAEFGKTIMKKGIESVEVRLHEGVVNLASVGMRAIMK